MCAHQLRRLLHGLVTEAGPQLTDQLLTHELNLLCALSLDALRLGGRLLLELSLDALRVVLGLVGDLLRLGLRVLQRLGVHGIGVGELAARLLALGERCANCVLLLLHQVAHGWDDPLVDDERDDREPDELSDEG